MASSAPTSVPSTPAPAATTAPAIPSTVSTSGVSPLRLSSRLGSASPIASIPSTVTVPTVASTLPTSSLSLPLPYLASPAPSEAAQVSIKLPLFWPDDADVWFAQAEAQFSIRRITDERTKYAYVVGALTKEYAVLVRDLLLNPPVALPFSTLKAALIKRTSDSDNTKLNQLLSAAQLGDQKPSQLLRHMERLLGDKTIDPSMFRQLFFQRLPKDVVLVLEATSSSGVSLATQAEIADTLMEISVNHHAPPTRIATVSQPIATPAVDSAAGEVTALRAEISALSKVLHENLHTGRSLNRSNSSSRTTSPGRQDSQPAGVCFYHRRFGDKARKCREPCTSSISGNSPARN